MLINIDGRRVMVLVVVLGMGTVGMVREDTDRAIHHWVLVRAKEVRRVLMVQVVGMLLELRRIGAYVCSWHLKALHVDKVRDVDMAVVADIIIPSYLEMLRLLHIHPLLLLRDQEFFLVHRRMLRGVAEVGWSEICEGFVEDLRL